jgi:hypothetical protein
MMADSHESVARWRDFEHAGCQEAAARYHDWLGGATRSADEPLLDAVGVAPDWVRPKLVTL